MDHIDRHLATVARTNTYKPCIQAAVAMGKKLLNKYYSATDHSELYRIAMGEFSRIIAVTFTRTYILVSPSSQSQARIFPTSWVGGRMAGNSRANCSR